MWLQMTALIKNFGSVEMAAFSLVLISIFLVFIISTYGLIICIFDSSFGAAIFVYIFLCLLSFFYMFMLSDCAHKIKDQIGFKFNKKFLEVSMYDFDEEKQIEVEKFLEAMAMENPEINISGYLVVDRTLIVKFIATSVTYLIVLLQFKTSAEEGQREAAEKTSTPRPRPTS
ncbi:gustatory and odorant receptor 24-like [Bemisia tabaci]|uniref:gustatory and odorant receptor 24-like n=1 Tax=Bemisia tabaci TaxID=7038 RepID=UPI003B27DBD9